MYLNRSKTFYLLYIILFIKSFVMFDYTHVPPVPWRWRLVRLDPPCPRQEVSTFFKVRLLPLATKRNYPVFLQQFVDRLVRLEGTAGLW